MDSTKQQVLGGDNPSLGSPVGFRFPQHTVPALTTTPPQTLPLWCSSPPVCPLLSAVTGTIIGLKRVEGPVVAPPILLDCSAPPVSPQLPAVTGTLIALGLGGREGASYPLFSTVPPARNSCSAVWIGRGQDLGSKRPPGVVVIDLGLRAVLCSGLGGSPTLFSRLISLPGIPVMRYG